MLVLGINWALISAVFCAMAHQHAYGQDEIAGQHSSTASGFQRLQMKHYPNTRVIDFKGKTKREPDSTQNSRQIFDELPRKLTDNDDTKKGTKRQLGAVQNLPLQGQDKRDFSEVQNQDNTELKVQSELENQGNRELSVQSELSPEQVGRTGKDMAVSGSGQSKTREIPITRNNDQMIITQRRQSTDAIKSMSSVEKNSIEFRKRIFPKKTGSTLFGGGYVPLRSHETDVNVGLTDNDKHNQMDKPSEISNKRHVKPVILRVKRSQKSFLGILDTPNKDHSSNLENVKFDKTVAKDSDFEKSFFLKNLGTIFHFRPGTFCKNSPTFHNYLKLNNYFKSMTRASQDKRSSEKHCGCYMGICDCSKMKLTSIPELSNPEKVIGLDLMINSIVNISDLSKFPSLKFLRLCCNNISKLHSNTFSGLGELEYLSLAGNSLEMSRTNFPDGLFSNLTNLVHLELQGNNKYPFKHDLHYPGRALLGLSELTTLQIDGLANQTFGKEFQNLTSLKSVQMPGFSSGYCSLEAINEITFSNLPPSVDYLNISNCNIFGPAMSSRTLMPLKNLRKLDISYNSYIGLDKFNEAMCNIQNYTLEELFASSFVTRYSHGIHITKEIAQCLPIKLKKLIAVSNSIESFDEEVFDNLPKNLEFLDMSDNKLTFGTYLQYIFKIKNLHKLLVEGSKYLYSIPTFYPSDNSDQHTYDVEQETSQLAYPDEISDEGTDLYQSEQQTSFGLEDEASDLLDPVAQELNPDTQVFDLPSSNLDPMVEKTNFVLHLPPNLNHVSLQKYGLRYILSTLTVNESNNLEYLNLDYNFFPEILGDFSGLDSLKILRLVKCSTYYINARLFQSLPALEKIFLQQNFLGTTRYFSQGLFKHAANLLYLNLDTNQIKYFSPDTFDGLTNLRTLLLYNNPFFDFRVDLSHTNRLKFLNVHSTSLHTFQEVTRRTIDENKIILNIQKTPILCDCNNLQFLKWISATKSVKWHGKYYCDFQTGKRERMVQIDDKYQHTITVLEGECFKHITEFCWLLAVWVLFLSAVLVYRFRWKIRYFYYGAYLRFKDDSKNKGLDQFKYDVFLSYAFKDSDFVHNQLNTALTSRGLKVHLHGRDFVAGEYIASNIVSAVMQSRKTLVVLTENLLKSDWCNYELQMANLEAVNTGRPVLVFLLKERIPKSKLGRQLLYRIDNNTYKPYPPEELTQNNTIMNRFWDSLVQDIRQ